MEILDAMAQGDDEQEAEEKHPPWMTRAVWRRFNRALFDILTKSSKNVDSKSPNKFLVNFLEASIEMSRNIYRNPDKVSVHIYISITGNFCPLNFF